MLRINSFLISSSVSYENNGNSIQLNAPLAIVSPPVKGTYSFIVSLSVLGLDFYTQHNMQCVLTSPNGEKIFETKKSGIPVIEKDKTNNVLPEDFMGFLINIDLRNVFFNQSGLYEFDVFIDEKKLNIQYVPVWISNEEGK